jgi:uncharacterized Zn-binding protein involved in type VI secretion
MSGAMPAARVGDPIAHSNAALGMALGILAGVVVGAVLVGATIASGGAALAVVAAVGGAAGLTSFGGLKGMAIGGASMGPPTGALTIGSFDVFINARPATMTAMATALCAKDPGPIPLATGSSTVMINGSMAGREGETMACSAKVVAACSPNVIIGGASAQDPRVTITPEVPEWAVTSLQVLGLVGAVMALPYSIAALGVGGTLAAGVLGAGGSYVGGKAMRALGESMGMSEAGILTMEAFGELGGGMLGGAAGARRFGTPRTTPRLPQDVAVNPKPPPALSTKRPVGRSPTQNAQVQRDIADIRAAGGRDIRVNQQQVNARGERVGINRPDLQYTDVNGRRVNIEYDVPSSARGPMHETRILANDPSAIVILKKVP